jgi:hypothetical protein
MNVFQSLCPDTDSSEDEEMPPSASESNSSRTLIRTEEEGSASAGSSADAVGWSLVGSKDVAESEDNGCFVCSRGFTRKQRGTTIPCSTNCNSEVKVHRRCLDRWRQTKETCPLCRSSLISLDKVEERPVGIVANDDIDFTTVVVSELDVKARRASAARRLGKTDTFKVTMQRNYSKAKREAQRQQSKQSTAVSSSSTWDAYEEEGW